MIPKEIQQYYGIFALMSPEKIKYAVLLIAGVAVLLFGLAYYLKSTESRERSSQE